MAIYGGHISGRRLRGVKINPLYQESGSGRNEGNQSGTSALSDEIQIEMYESMPRHRFFQPSISTPNISQTHSTSLSRLPYVYNGHMAYLGDARQGDETRHFSDFSMPRPRGGTVETHHQEPENHHQEHETTIKSDDVDSGNTKEHSRPWSWPHSDRGYRIQLIRQSGMDLTSDEPDVREIIDLLPSTSNSSFPTSSPSSSLTSITKTQFSQMKRRGTPRSLKPKCYPRKCELSVLQEQSSSGENENSNGSDDTGAMNDLACDYYGDFSIPSDCSSADNGKDYIPCGKEDHTHQFSNEMCHSVSFTDGKQMSHSKLFSPNNEDQHFFNDINVQYHLFETDDHSNLPHDRSSHRTMH